MLLMPDDKILMILNGLALFFILMLSVVFYIITNMQRNFVFAFFNTNVLF